MTDTLQGKGKAGPRSGLLLKGFGFLSAAALCKALGAIDRFVVSRLERHLGGFAASGADRVKHLALRSACRVLACSSAFRATNGIVFEIVLCVKFLFACAENEFLAAISANQCSVFVHVFFASLRDIGDDTRFRLTWSLPPHSPAGGFAPKQIAPHYCPSRRLPAGRTYF